MMSGHESEDTSVPFSSQPHTKRGISSLEASGSNPAKRMRVGRASICTPCTTPSTTSSLLSSPLLQPSSQAGKLFLCTASLTLWQSMNIYIYILNIVFGRAKRVPHCGVQSRFRVIYIYVYMSVCLVCQINCVGGIT